MQAGTPRRLILVTGMLALAGCRDTLPAAVEVTPVPPPQPFVFYDETGEPSERTPALSEVELREIIDLVATQTSDSVWLIRVRPSMSKRRNPMVAYLVPDEATSRVRVGRAYDIAVSKEKMRVYASWRYAQVSMPDRRFTDQLTKPSALDMPFRHPEVIDPNSKESSPMAQEELIRIVDFARQPSNYQDPAIQSALRWSRERPYDWPIVGIRREGNIIHVSSGFVHDFLWGRTWSIRLESTTSGYRVTSAHGPYVF